MTNPHPHDATPGPGVAAAAAQDPFPAIYALVPGALVEAASSFADVIAGGAAGLWHPDRKTGPNEPTPDTVRMSIANGLGLLRDRFGGVDFNGRHWCAMGHADCPDPDEIGDAATGFDGSLGVGSVYTPRSLADQIVQWTLEPLVYSPGPRETADREKWRLLPADRLLALRIVDIAAGSGAFVVAACRYLAERVAEAWERDGRRPQHDTWWAAREVAANCLYSVDINPLALELAKVAVCLTSWLHHREPPHLHDHFVATDALLGREFWQMFPSVFLERGGFDAVIGNPPWLGGHKITGEFGTEYRERLVGEIARGKRGKADLCAYFALRGWDLLNPNGQLGMVCTNTIAQGATREVGLTQICDAGGTIMHGVKSEKWPTKGAAVHFSAFSISKAPLAVDAPRWLHEFRAA